MKTSRAHVDWLLDPENDRVQLDNVQRAAAAVAARYALNWRNGERLKTGQANLAAVKAFRPNRFSVSLGKPSSLL